MDYKIKYTINIPSDHGIYTAKVFNCRNRKDAIERVKTNDSIVIVEVKKI